MYYSFGQKYQEINLPNSDNHKLHYGFIIGGHTSKFRHKLNDYFINSDTITAISTPNSPGFSLGFLVNKRLGDYFDLRLMPTAGFHEFRVKYDSYNPDENRALETVIVVAATYAEFPLLLKYKSQRRKNFRMYFTGGIKPSFEVTNRKNEDDATKEITVGKTNLSIDYGVGVDIYYPMFKFSPELRFSHGLIDMLAPYSRSDYNKPLHMIKTHTVSLFFIFGS